MKNQIFMYQSQFMNRTFPARIVKRYPYFVVIEIKCPPPEIGKPNRYYKTTIDPKTLKTLQTL